MCLSIPSKVVKIDPELNVATVETMGVMRKASLDLIDQNVEIGDYVLIHIGFAMNKIDKKDALESLNTYQEIMALMEDEEKQRLIEESDNCANRGEDG